MVTIDGFMVHPPQQGSTQWDVLQMVEQDYIGIDSRVENALSDSFHVEGGSREYAFRVHSGSGSTYAVDLNAPTDSGVFCSCDDPETWCKHLLYVMLNELGYEYIDSLVVPMCKYDQPYCGGADSIVVEDGQYKMSDGAPGFACHHCFTEVNSED